MNSATATLDGDEQIDSSSVRPFITGLTFPEFGDEILQ